MRALALSHVLAGILIAALAAPAVAQLAPPQQDYPAVPLLSTGTTILGEKIKYPSGDAKVTAAIVTLAPGGRTVLHTHDVPL